MRSRLFIGDATFGIALAFLAGIFAASMPWNIVFVILLVGMGLGGMFVAQRKYGRELLMFFCAFILGITYLHFFLYRKTATIAMPFGKETELTALVGDEPLPSEKYLIVSAETRPPLKGALKILAPPTADIQYGDVIKLAGVIEKPDTPGDDPIMFSPKQITVTARGKGFFLRSWMIDLKRTAIAGFQSSLPADEAAFLGGIVFGSKAGASDALKTALSLTGTTHLIAVSGFKVTIVIVTARELFAGLFSRRTAFAASIAFLTLFILMVGFEASAIRAAIMGVIALIARETGEGINPRNAVTFTALAMALINPTILTGDLSFQISFLAVLGILYLGPPFKKLFHYTEEGLFAWKEAGITTLAAQLATMPILMNAFGQFSPAAIPANVLTLSLLPLTMFSGFILACTNAVTPFLAFGPRLIADLITKYQLAVIRAFAAIALPLPLPLGSAFAIGLYYLTLILFIFSYTNDDRDFAKI